MAAVAAVEERVALPGRLAGDLLAAERARGRAHGAPLPADRLRDDDHHLPRPAPDRRPTCRRCSPTWFFAVPRMWEKLKAGLEAHLRPTRRGARCSSGATRGWSAAGGRGRRRTLPRRGATAAVRRAARRRSGLDQAVLVNVGAAPTPREVLVFFHAIGVPLAEIWGMSETCGAGASNPARADQDRHGRPAVAGHRGQAGRGRRAARALAGRDGRLPQPARAHGRGAGRRRLAAHRRRGHDRRGRLHHDRRPQEGADHQRGRQEHVAGEHRGGGQGRHAAARRSAA